MKVTQYNTNNYGNFIPQPLFPSLHMNGAVTAQKSEESAANNDFLGFGVAVTGSSCYNLFKMPKDERTQFLKSIYGKSGLALSIGRLSIGSSDYSAELYTYDDADSDKELKYFSVSRDEKYIIPMIKEILEINPDLKLFASPWSPPGWMKTGGSVCGGHMREEFIECYAGYFVKFLQEYKKHGIDIFAVTPQNEPETSQLGKMPACVWNPETEARFTSALRKKLAENNLDTEIWIHDHNFGYCDRPDWILKEYKEVKDDCNGIAFHYYDGNIEQTRYLKSLYPKLKLHFTEGGPRLSDHYDTDQCKWAVMMCKALNNSYSSFTGWNLLLDETGGPNIGPFFCGGLSTLNKLSGELSYSGQYKALQHFSPFINKNSTVYPIEFINDNDAMSDYYNAKKRLIGSVAENKNGSASLILVNPNSRKAQIQYFYNKEWWYFELLPETVATVCFEA